MNVFKRNMSVVTLKLEEELLEKLDNYAKQHRMNRSEAIRELIKAYLKEEKINYPASTFDS